MQPRLWVPLSRDHAPAEVQKQLDEFAEAMKAVDYEDEQSARSLYSFAGLINLAKVVQGSTGDHQQGRLHGHAAGQGLPDLPRAEGDL